MPTFRKIYIMVMPDENGKVWLAGNLITAAGAVIQPLEQVQFVVDGEDISLRAGKWGVGRIVPDSIDFEEILEAIEKNPGLFANAKNKAIVSEPKRKSRGDIL